MEKTIPAELAQSGQLFKKDVNGNRMSPFEKKTGVYFYEFTDGGGAVRRIFNLCTVNFDNAVETARKLVEERRASASVTVAGKPEQQVLDFGAPFEFISAWAEYEKSAEYGKISEKTNASHKTEYGVFTKWLSDNGVGSLMGVGAETARKYVEWRCGTLSENSFKKVYYYFFLRFWDVVFPNYENVWKAVKWDSKRQSWAKDCKADGRTSLLNLAEMYFSHEATSGRKSEANTHGFMTHLINAEGVSTAGEVTKEKAVDYAVKLAEDPVYKTARNGQDRLSKLSTIWETMLPGTENPWKNLSYEEAVKIRKYNEAMRNSSDPFRSEDVSAVFGEFAKNAGMNSHRAATDRWMYNILYRKTGCRCAAEITAETADRFASELKEEKKSWRDFIYLYSRMWKECFSGHENVWEHVLQNLKSETEVEKQTETADSDTVKFTGMTADEVLAVYCDRMKGRVLDKTLAGYCRVWRGFALWAAGEKGITVISEDNVTLQMATEYDSYLRQIFSEKTVRSYISILKNIHECVFYGSRWRNWWSMIWRDKYAYKEKKDADSTEELTEQPRRSLLSRLADWFRRIF